MPGLSRPLPGSLARLNIALQSLSGSRISATDRPVGKLSTCYMNRPRSCAFAAKRHCTIGTAHSRCLLAPRTRGAGHTGNPRIPLERRMTGRIALATTLIAALLTFAAMMPQAKSQALGPDEAHGAPAPTLPHVALSPAQKRAIYSAVARRRLRT